MAGQNAAPLLKVEGLKQYFRCLLYTSGITAVDDKTLKVDLNVPVSYFLSLMYLSLIHISQDLDHHGNSGWRCGLPGSTHHLLLCLIILLCGACLLYTSRCV